MPQIARFLEGLAPRADTVESRIDALRPTVTSMSVANGATNVDPALKEIVIRSDLPMNNSWSFAKPGPGLSRKIDKPRLDGTGAIFTMAVTLEPARKYEFILNLPGGHFSARDGAALKPVLVHFATVKAQ